jgi:hypothetical protein
MHSENLGIHQNGLTDTALLLQAGNSVVQMDLFQKKGKAIRISPDK